MLPADIRQIVLRMKPDDSVILTVSGEGGRSLFPNLEEALDRALKMARAEPSHIAVYDAKGNPIILT